MPRTIVVEVPQLPPASSSPNARCHWRVRHKEAKEFKQVVGLTVLATRIDDDRPFERPVMQVEFVVAERRRRDADNWMARMKPGTDAIVGMGLLKDDDSDYLQTKQPVFTVDRTRAPMTIIRITEGE